MASFVQIFLLGLAFLHFVLVPISSHGPHILQLFLQNLCWYLVFFVHIDFVGLAILHLDFFPVSLQTGGAGDGDGDGDGDGEGDGDGDGNGDGRFLHTQANWLPQLLPSLPFPCV